MTNEKSGAATLRRRGDWRGAIIPKVTAVMLFLVIWQVVYISGWKPSYIFVSPFETFLYLADTVTTQRFWDAVGNTLGRALVGFTIAVVVGTVLGLAVAQWKIVRSAIGALLSSLLTMPSIVWFPLAILLFGLTQEAIFFVIVLGAAPSIANGIIAGVDDIPPAFLKVGHALGARGVDRYRFVILPAILPSYVGGMSQGWAFAWRSLMAGELLVAIPGMPSLGSDLSFAGDMGSSAQLFGLMLVILVIGVGASGAFTSIASRVRRARGLVGFRPA